MPSHVVHFGQKHYTRDEWGVRQPVIATACSVSANWAVTTRKMEEVTCKRCLRKIGGPPVMAPEQKEPARPTAWDRLDALDGALPTPEVQSPTAPDVPSDPERRIALVFFHLMRRHLGIDAVTQIVALARQGVTSSDPEDHDLETRAARYAKLLLNSTR